MFRNNIINIVINVCSQRMINTRETKSALQYMKQPKDFKANRLAKCHRFAVTLANIVNLMFRVRPTKPQITTDVS